MKGSQKKKSVFNPAHLAEFYKGEFPRFYGAMLFTIAGAALSLLMPLVFRFVIDTVLNGEAPDLPRYLVRLFVDAGGHDYFLKNLWIIGLIIVGIHLIEGILSFFKGKWASIFAENGSRRMRGTLYRHIQNLPFSYHATAETGDLVQRCTSDVDTVRRFINGQIYEMVRFACLVGASAMFMLLLDPLMALIALSTTPLIFISSLIYFRKQRQAFHKWDEAEGHLSTLIQESLTGIRVVKAFARHEHENEKFREKNNDLRGYAKEFIRLMSTFWMYSDFICLLQIGITTVVGVLFVIDGRISLGLMIAFVIYTDMLLYPLRGLARMLSDAGRMQISFGRLEDILKIEPEPSDESLDSVAATGRLEFRDVSFAYGQMDRMILKDISFSVEKGETIGILGPTGSGKSTLMYLLQKLYDPTEGSILVDGKDMREISRYSVRKNVGFVLQEPFVFSRTLFDNIRLPRPEASEDMVYDVARTASIHSDIESFDDGYQTMVGERGVTLSGGQQQRVTIARTLIRECPILVFDDSLSAVDTETDAKIRSELADRHHRATTLIISHRISTLSAADKILVMENGAITQQGRHEELIEQDGLYRRVYEIQNAFSEDEEREGNL